MQWEHDGTQMGHQFQQWSLWHTMGHAGGSVRQEAGTTELDLMREVKVGNIDLEVIRIQYLKSQESQQ